MKATERCSCSAEFTAEGRGVKAALLEWRQTHQHTTTTIPGTQPYYPTYPTITYTTRSIPGNVCEVLA